MLFMPLISFVYRMPYFLPVRGRFVLGQTYNCASLDG